MPGGRPPKYKTDEERKEARRRQMREHYYRNRDKCLKESSDYYYKNRSSILEKKKIYSKKRYTEDATYKKSCRDYGNFRNEAKRLMAIEL